MVGTSAEIFLMKEAFIHIMHDFFLPSILSHACGKIISFMRETSYGCGDSRQPQLGHMPQV